MATTALLVQSTIQTKRNQQCDQQSQNTLRFSRLCTTAITAIQSLLAKPDIIFNQNSFLIKFNRRLESLIDGLNELVNRNREEIKISKKT